MAGDWIKMRLNLVTHPKVMRVAQALVENRDYREWSGLHWVIPSEDERQARYDALRITRYVTVTALLRWWGYANEHIEDETIVGLWPDDIDQIAGVPGFCEAIEGVGWIEIDVKAGSVRVPNFNKYNVQAPNRGLSMTPAERQKAYRERLKQRDVTRYEPLRNDRDAREDKRREDKKEQPKEEVAVLPDWLPLEAWKAWLEMRKSKKVPNTPRALKLALGELERMKSQGYDPLAVIDQSTLKGWKTFYPLKDGLPVVEPKGAICDYCAHVASGQVNGRRACDEHWNLAMDNEKPTKVNGTHSHDAMDMKPRRMLGVVAKPVAGAD
jgi:hypothetical protein